MKYLLIGFAILALSFQPMEKECECSLGAWWINPHTDVRNFVTDDYSEVEKAMKNAGNTKMIAVVLGKCNGKEYYFCGELAE